MGQNRRLTHSRKDLYVYAMNCEALRRCSCLPTSTTWPLVGRRDPPTTGLSQQSGTSLLLKRARTGTLEIAYEDSGPDTGFPVLLIHGFPYDPRCYDEVLPPLVAAGYRTIVRYLRGFGATRFLSAETPRSGQQAATCRDRLSVFRRGVSVLTQAKRRRIFHRSLQAPSDLCRPIHSRRQVVTASNTNADSARDQCTPITLPISPTVMPLKARSPKLAMFGVRPG